MFQGVSVVIPGMRTRDHVAGNLVAALYLRLVMMQWMGSEKLTTITCVSTFTVSGRWQYRLAFDSAYQIFACYEVHQFRYVLGCPNMVLFGFSLGPGDSMLGPFLVHVLC